MTRSELQEMSAVIDTLMDRGRKGEAEPLLERALAASAPDRAYHLFFQAEAAGYLQRDHRKRERLLAEGVKEAPGDAFLLRNMGVCHLLAERLLKARRLFEEALKAEPGDADTLRCLGLICSMRGKESRAMEWYRRALEVRQDDNDALRQVGVSLSKLGKDREALDWYRRALEACEQDYDAMRQMGISFAMLGDYSTALTWLNLALTVNPGDLESKRNIKLVQRKQSGRDDSFGGAIITRIARGMTVAWRRLMDRIG